MAVEEAGKGIADGLVLKFSAEVESGDGEGSDLDELPYRIHMAVDLNEHFIAVAFNVEKADGVSMSDHGSAVIALRGLLAEVRAVNL